MDIYRNNTYSLHPYWDRMPNSIIIVGLDDDSFKNCRSKLPLHGVMSFHEYMHPCALFFNYQL